MNRRRLFITRYAGDLKTPLRTYRRCNRQRRLRVRLLVDCFFSASMNIRTRGVQAGWKIRETRRMASVKLSIRLTKVEPKEHSANCFLPFPAFVFRLTLSISIFHELLLRANG